MSLYGTCEHKITLEWFDSGKGEVKVKSRGKDETPIITYQVICEDCLVWFAKHNLIIRNENEEKRYLNL